MICAFMRFVLLLLNKRMIPLKHYTGTVLVSDWRVNGFVIVIRENFFNVILWTKKSDWTLYNSQRQPLKTMSAIPAGCKMIPKMSPLKCKSTFNMAFYLFWFRKYPNLIDRRFCSVLGGGGLRPNGVSARGVCLPGVGVVCPGGVYPGACLSKRGVSAQGGVCPWGCLPRGVYTSPSCEQNHRQV